MNRDSVKFSDAVKVKLKNGKLSLKGKLTSSDDLDLYRFDFTNRSNFNCSLNQLSGNVEVKLLNNKKKVVAISNERDGRAEFIRSFLKAGKYFLQIRRVSGDVSYKAKGTAVEVAGSTFSEALKINSAGSEIKTNAAYTGTIGGTAGKEAYYQFSLKERSTFISLLEGLSTDADIELLDANRQVLVSGSSTGITSELVDRVLEAGNYFLKIKVKNGSTKYKLNLGFNSTVVLNNISDPARIISLGSGKTFSNKFTGAVKLDNFYKLDLSTPSNVNLTLDGLSADANLQLLSSDGSIVASSSNTGTAQELVSKNLKGGTYFVRVLPGVGGLPTDYSLNVTLGALKLFGLTDKNSLVAFNPDKVGEAVNIDITGLASGETLKAIDFRPATGQLYGLSSTSKLYTVDLKTGAATSVGAALNPALTGTDFGFDFNPTVDRLRLVSDADENLRLVPTTGTLAATDKVLAYATTDANTGQNPNVTAGAYTNNFAGTTSTTLFGIDTTLNTLVRQGDANGTPLSPNEGTLFTIGALGVDFANNAAFDIFTDSSLTNTAYAISGSTLYTINLTTGAATSVGTVSIAPNTAATGTSTTGTSTSTTPVTTALNLVGLAARV